MCPRRVITANDPEVEKCFQEAVQLLRLNLLYYMTSFMYIVIIFYLYILYCIF